MARSQAMMGWAMAARMGARWPVVVLGVLCATACGSDDTLEPTPLHPAELGNREGGSGGADSGVDRQPCESHADCDDSVPCTRDRCDRRGYCRNTTDSSRCSDGVFCNGREICDPVRGCQPGTVRTCSDMDACTVDSCDEEAKECVHAPRDFDGDGEVDWHCSGGTDCDDFDATRASGMAEICADGVDNDCDGEVDETFDCGRPRHDICADALEVEGSGSYVVSMAGAASDYTLGCGEPGSDVVLRLALQDKADLTIDVDGFDGAGDPERVDVALRSNCEVVDAELECHGGIPAQLRTRSLPAGTYFILVSSQEAEQVLVEVTLEAPTPPPSHEVCADAQDVSAGGRFTASLVDVADDYTIGCGSSGAGDLVYSFTTEAEQDVVISGIAQEEAELAVALRSDCSDETTELRCLRGTPADGRLYSLAAGSYSLIVEAPGALPEVDFALDVGFEPPSEPPVGDSCDNPDTLPLNSTVEGTLLGKQDDESLSCGAYLPDAVYALEVQEATDVVLLADGGDNLMHLGVRSSCTGAEADHELVCVTGAPATQRVRNLQPGTYYVFVESPTDTKFALTADVEKLTVPVEVSDNDTCGTAYPVPADGGLFLGDTLDAFKDYQATCGGQAGSRDVVFELELTQSRRVWAELEGSFDPVLYRFRAGSDGPAACVSFTEEACDDDSGPGNASNLNEVLTAGRYYYVVDGFGDNSAGDYTLEMVVTAP